MSEPDSRLRQLEQWVRRQPGLKHAAVTPASADASFRRYFHVCSDTGCYIVMDAPPEKEDCAPFIDMTQRLEAAGLCVPHIHASDTEAGLLLLDDLGSEHYLQALNDTSAEPLYRDALDALFHLQSARQDGLPAYDDTLLRTELNLFRDWFLGAHLGISLDATRQARLEGIFDALINNALEQPRVFVHRDYHSRNLMVTTNNNPGIIDYQDAVLGPVTYDLVSLLRDCYIAWPATRVEAWALDYRDRLVARQRMPATSAATFMRWFDLMGIQRHLKAIGIFARLNHRDGKPGYLADIPRTLNYVLESAPRYAATAPLGELLETLDIPARLVA